jgi:hypothetical protein
LHLREEDEMNAMEDGGDRKPQVVDRRLEFDPESGPELSAEYVDEFLMWAGGVPVGAVDAVRTRIARARDDVALLGRLLDELWKFPVNDAGRHLLLLSTIGELRDGRAARPLAEFIWHPDERIAPVAYEQEIDGCFFGASTAELLKARAAEMLAYLNTEEAVEATLKIAAEHPAASVRAAAIDAHLFNHDDVPEEMDRLRGRVRVEDVPLVGLPRFTADKERQDFEREIREFYERHPEHMAPMQRDAAGPPPPRDGD